MRDILVDSQYPPLRGQPDWEMIIIGAEMLITHIYSMKVANSPRYQTISTIIQTVASLVNRGKCDPYCQYLDDRWE